MFLQQLKNVLNPDVTHYDPALIDQIDSSLLEKCKPHHRQAIELAMHDLYGKRMEALISLPGSWKDFICARVLKDKRDYPLMLTFLQCTIWIVFSSFIQLVVLPKSGWGYLWLVVHLPVTWVLLAERFILAMHYAAHRPLFSEKGAFGTVGWVLNNMPQIVLSNFWGMPSGAYHLHHIVMHHNVSFAPHPYTPASHHRAPPPAAG